MTQVHDESSPTNNCNRCRSCSVVPATPMPDVFLWVHMAQDDPLRAWPTSLLEKSYGVVCGRDLLYTDSYSASSGLAPEDMSSLYKMFDILLFLSGGEGFGVPAWEAMGSGVPVVYTDYSSHAEIIRAGNGGVPVGGTLQPQPGDCVQRIVADMGQAIEAVRKLILDPQLRAQLGENGSKYTETFSVPLQVDRWHALFQEVLSETPKTFP